MEPITGECLSVTLHTVAPLERPVAVLLMRPKGAASVNVINETFVTELARVVQAVAGATGKSRPALLVIASAVAGSFCHGADVSAQVQLQQQQSAETTLAAVNGLKAVLQQLEDLPIPTLCLINGPALGGGLEMALACSYRLALLTDASTPSMGLPEVKIGILPAAGGCVRLPRLIGLPAALPLLLSGKVVSAAEAVKAGVVHGVVKAAGLQPAEFLSVLSEQYFARGKFTRRLPLAQKYPRHLTSNTWVEQQLIYSQAIRSLDKTTARRYPAPYVCLSTVIEAWNQPLKQAMETETHAYMKLAQSPEAASLMALFTAKSDIKRRSWHPVREALGAAAAAESSQPLAVLMLGAGHMGTGLGQHLAAQGVSVTLYDVNEAALTAAKLRVDRLFQGMIKRKKVTVEQAAEKKRLLSYTTLLDPAGFEAAALAKQQTPVVIEAVPEDLELKRRILQQVLSSTQRTIFATNTSSLPIADVSLNCPDPSRVVGLHFFHPEGDITPSVEVIRSATSGIDATHAALRVAAKMNKTPVTVGDGPGFVMNRVARCFYGMAAHLLVFGGASVRRVDKLMTDFGFPAGPFAIIDGIGLATARKVGQCISSRLHDTDAAAVETLLATMLAAGFHGRHIDGTSFGFYHWRNGHNQGVNEQVKSIAQRTRSEIAAAENRSAGGDTLRTARIPQLSDDDVRDALLLSLLNESCLLLELGIAKSAVDVDFLMVTALGFPPPWTGICAWADRYGLDKAVTRTRELAERLRLTSVKPAAYLENVARAGGKLRPDLPAFGSPQGAARVSRWAPTHPGWVEAAVVAFLAAAALHLLGLDSVVVSRL